MTGEWRRSAACLGKAPLFDATIDDDGAEPKKARIARWTQAVEICNTCPVRNECIADFERGRDEGIRDGRVLPPIAGKPLTGSKGPGQYSKAAHGTEAAARAHYRRGESYCPACAGANNAAREARRARKDAS